jgi:hypothetical protein
MGKMRVSVAIEVELDAAEPAPGFAAIVAAVAEEIGAAPDPLRASGSAVGKDGRVGWRVSAIDEAALTTCMVCRRRVPRSETDVREDGEICRACVLTSEVGEHIERATDNAFRDGVTTAALLVAGPLDGVVDATLIDALFGRRRRR